MVAVKDANHLLVNRAMVDNANLTNVILNRGCLLMELVRHVQD